MNKTAIKNFAIWARNKLITDIQYKAGLMGVTAEGIKTALPQSTKETEFYDIGTAEPYAITGEAIKQRRSLVDVIEQKEHETDYKTAYKYIIEGVAYTWFNRLIAVRFMEVNDYLPSHIRVLSSDSGKMEPDLVTTPFDAELTLSEEEKQEIIRLKNENNLDEVFRGLFIKQCNALNEVLPALFEKTADYTELLLNISAIDKEGVVYHLVNDISEDDFNIEKGGQIEIIGWLYQYYNTEPKNEAFAKNGKITKEEIPAVTQLFTPDWIVRYMVENSLGRLWVEGHPNDLLKSKWKYYLEEADQEPEVQAKLEEIHKEYAKLNPEDIHFIDPCMGSGHILVYAFDVLMQIYESAGYSQRDAARSILENNLYGLDIDDRAYQMAYFAVMMKARQYNRRILSADTACHVYSIQDSNSINRNQLAYFGAGLSELEKNDAMNQINGLLDTFRDAKEYGSILIVENYNWDLLRRFVCDVSIEGQMTLDAVGLPQTQEKIRRLIDIGETMARKYEVVVTNPPYMGNGKMDSMISSYLRDVYPLSKNDMSTVCMERSKEMTASDGFISMINIPVWMFLSGYEKFRQKLLETVTIVNMVHPGRGVFGSDFGTTIFTICNRSRSDYKGRYQRLFDKPGEVEPNETRERQFLERKGMYISAQKKYDLIPGYSIAYWVNESIASIFSKYKMLSQLVDYSYGLKTGNNEKYVRLWFEVSYNKMYLRRKTDIPPSNTNYKWFPCNMGGSYRKWYGNYAHLVNWENDGYELKNSSNSGVAKTELYFREAISWTDISSSYFGVRYYEEGVIGGNSGPCIYPQKGDALYLSGLMTAKVATYFMRFLSPTIHNNVGDVTKLPIIFDRERRDEVESVVATNIELSKNEWDSFETSWDYKRHPLLPPREQTDHDQAFTFTNGLNESASKDALSKYSDQFTDDELHFAIFCIESIAERLNVDSVIVYDAMAKNSDILQQYIVPCYETLHSQDKEYIVDEILEVMKERGVKL